MNITQEDIKLLEGGLKELLSPSPREDRSSKVITRKRSFDDLYASMPHKKQKIQSSHKEEPKLSYEEEQKLAEKKWLEQRAKTHELMNGYDSKLLSKPHITFYAQ
jgi:hypothetical protein